MSVRARVLKLMCLSPFLILRLSSQWCALRFLLFVSSLSRLLRSVCTHTLTHAHTHARTRTRTVSAATQGEARYRGGSPHRGVRRPACCDCRHRFLSSLSPFLISEEQGVRSARAIQPAYFRPLSSLFSPPFVDIYIYLYAHAHTPIQVIRSGGCSSSPLHALSSFIAGFTLTVLPFGFCVCVHVTWPAFSLRRPL